LHRLGNSEFASISEGLGKMDIPEGGELQHGLHMNQILDFFGARITPDVRVRPVLE
jgi:hypothetical protein